MQNQMTARMSDPALPRTDWTGEITGTPQQYIPYNDPAALREAGAMAAGISGAGTPFVEPNQHAVLPGVSPTWDAAGSMEQFSPQQPNMNSGLSPSAIGDPQTNQEAYLGSMKASLARNIGNFIVATFLIGTQGTVSWEGILYSVGNDYVTIYQAGRDRFIVCDLYSLKYVEFYDTRRRAMCNQLLSEQNYANQTNH